MIVVADSSPVIALVNIGHIGLLPELFQRVFVPPAVMRELRSQRRTPEIRDWAERAPEWLIELRPKREDPIGQLDAGETAAIHLAMELGAGVLLIDEAKGRRAAEDRRIEVTGTIGVLELAAGRGRIDLQHAFERLSSTDFWVTPKFLAERLRVFRARRGQA